MTSPYQVRLRALRQPTIRLRPRARYEPRDPTSAFELDGQVSSPLQGQPPERRPDRSSEPGARSAAPADPDDPGRVTVVVASSAAAQPDADGDRVTVNPTTTNPATINPTTATTDRSALGPRRRTADRATAEAPTEQAIGHPDPSWPTARHEALARGAAGELAEPVTARRPTTTLDRSAAPTGPNHHERSLPRQPPAIDTESIHPTPGPLPSRPGTASRPESTPRPEAPRAPAAGDAGDDLLATPPASARSAAPPRPADPPPSRPRPRRENAAPESMDVHVSIGRIDVRSSHVAPPAPAVSRAARKSTQTTLDDYLRARTAGRVG